MLVTITRSPQGNSMLVEKTNGEKYQGVFHTAVFDRNGSPSYEIILKMARKLVILRPPRIMVHSAVGFNVRALCRTRMSSPSAASP